jgi:hypothetical protein
MLYFNTLQIYKVGKSVKFPRKEDSDFRSVTCYQLKLILHHHDPRPTLPLYKAGKGFKTKLLYRIQKIIYLYE